MTTTKIKPKNPPKLLKYHSPIWKMIENTTIGRFYFFYRVLQLEVSRHIPEKLVQLSRQPHQRRGKNPQSETIWHQYDVYQHNSSMLQKKMELPDQSKFLHATIISLSISNQKQFCWLWKIAWKWSQLNILVRVTDPVINMAETSRTRNKKKSHLFFCITSWTVQNK